MTKKLTLASTYFFTVYSFENYCWSKFQYVLLMGVENSIGILLY